MMEYYCVMRLIGDEEIVLESNFLTAVREWREALSQHQELVDFTTSEGVTIVTRPQNILYITKT